MRRLVLSILLLTFTTSLSAQHYARPAKTPNTDVKCTGCSDRAKDQLTPGYPAALGTYVGRYLDSQTTNDCQQPVRTFRAVNVVPMPSLNRLYFIIGSSVTAYDMDRFFQRVAAGESLTPNAPCGVPQPVTDAALQFDEWFYAELQPVDSETKVSSSGWDVGDGGDGQTRLYGIDVDDQGYVYLATKWYRWGIVKDDRRHDGGLMQFVWQAPKTDDAIVPVSVASLRGSSGSYFAVISDTVSSTMNVFDVSDHAAPKKRPNTAKSMWQFAKNADSTRLAVATTDGHIEIYTTDSFVSGGQPLLSDLGPFGAAARGVASDGTNFYASFDGGTGLVIAVYAPDGAGYKKVQQLVTSRPTLATLRLSYGAGYLVQAGFTGGQYELRLFKASPAGVSEFDLSVPKAPGVTSFAGYFQNYYVANSSGRDGYVAAGLFGQFHDSAVVRSGGKTYPVVAAHGLGDVYQLDGTAVPQQPATHLAVSAPSSVTTGSPFNVSVAALDASNATGTYVGTVHFSSSSAGNLPANYTFTPADGGFHTFNVSLNATGKQTITVADTATPSITGAAAVNVSSVPPPPPPPPPPSGCGIMNPPSNVFISYFSADDSCAFFNSKACSAGQVVSFTASAFGYDFACAKHSFSWNFGDGSGASTQKAPHAYAAAGSYVVTLVISSPTQTVRTTQQIVLVDEGPPPPPPPPPTDCSKCPTSSCTPPATCQVCPTCPPLPPALPPCDCRLSVVPCSVSSKDFINTCLGPPPPPICPPLGPRPVAGAGCVVTEDDSGACPAWKVTCQPPSGSCPAIVPNTNVFVFYNATRSGCWQGADDPCSTSEEISFDVFQRGYPWFCSTHHFKWDFGDGQTSPDLEKSAAVSHHYGKAGTYNVTVTVTVNGVSTVIPQTVKVAEQ